MNDLSFDAVTRYAATALSRRASLMTLGGAGVSTLAAVARPITADARKQSAAKKAKKKCKKQIGPCVTAVAPDCSGDPACLAGVRRCCGLAGICDIIGFFTCLPTIAP